MVKGEFIVKRNYKNPKDTIYQCFLKLPIVENCRPYSEGQSDCDLMIRFKAGKEKRIRVEILEHAYPKHVSIALERFRQYPSEAYNLIFAPFISEEAAQLCRQKQVGYIDEAGNMEIMFDTIYICIKGNPNRAPESRRTGGLFRTSATTSALVLRKLLEDTNRAWKLKYLSQEVGCSIGLVSRVKNTLCDQMWAEMTEEGLKITDSEGLLKAWSREYQLQPGISCYTLDSIPAFEKRLSELEDKYGIRNYLTGFAGGVRYAPVVRYNKIHVMIEAGNFEKFIQYSGCKRVDSGANVIILEASQDKTADARIRNDNTIVSPVQAYLDCMQLKGRGEELAEAIYSKEISKYRH